MATWRSAAHLWERMNVKLIEITPKAERQIAWIARVSNPQNQDNPNYERLIRYLIDHKHWSPFEHAHATFEIQTSRSIGRQLLRHRSFTFQEFSQRYSEVQAFEPIALRKQASKNRQSSTEPLDDPELTAAIQEAQEACMRAYRMILERGGARECARLILPETTSTTMYMTGNIRSWITFLQVRDHPDAQEEVQAIARAIRQQLAEHCPIIMGLV